MGVVQGHSRAHKISFIIVLEFMFARFVSGDLLGSIDYLDLFTSDIKLTLR